jgi:hypothetical protein
MSTITRTIQSLKDGTAALLTRKNLNSVVNLYNALERAFRTFQQKATVPEAMGSQIITLYDGVNDYIAPAPIFGSSLKDARPVGNFRMPQDVVSRQYNEDFDRNKGFSMNGYGITFETQNGVNLMRVNTRFTPRKTLIDPMSDDSKWTSGGSLSNLANDTSFYYQPSASLRFTLTGASSGYIEKTLTNALDLTDFLNVGVAFLALELPTLNLSSVELRLGSDNANYYKVSVSQGQLGAWTVGDFLDTPFDLSKATKVGNPVITAIKYVRLTFTTTATITNARCGYLWISLPSQHKFLFTSTGIFKAADGSINNFITADTDIILLNDAAYNLYEHECALTVGAQEGGTLAEGMLASINSMLNGARARNGQIIQLGLYDKFRASNPTEDIAIGGQYYED